MEERFGFIREKLDIKLLILFILRRLPGTVSHPLLTEFVQCDGAVGYFDYSDCLAELVETGLVLEVEGGYRISERGDKACATVESSLPYSVRKKAEKLIEPEAERLRRLNLLTAEHRFVDQCCFVTLAINDGKGEILRTEILCDGEAQAKRIENNFRINAEQIYTQMIELLDK